MYKDTPTYIHTYKSIYTFITFLNKISLWRLLQDLPVIQSVNSTLVLCARVIIIIIVQFFSVLFAVVFFDYSVYFVIHSYPSSCACLHYLCVRFERALYTYCWALLLVFFVLLLWPAVLMVLAHCCCSGVPQLWTTRAFTLVVQLTVDWTRTVAGGAALDFHKKN